MGTAGAKHGRTGGNFAVKAVAVGFFVGEGIKDCFVGEFAEKGEDFLALYPDTELDAMGFDNVVKLLNYNDLVNL